MSKIAMLTILLETEEDNMGLAETVNRKLGGNVSVKIEENFDNWQDCASYMLREYNF